MSLKEEIYDYIYSNENGKTYIEIVEKFGNDVSLGRATEMLFIEGRIYEPLTEVFRVTKKDR